MVPVDIFSKSIFSVLKYLEKIMSENNKPGNLSGLLAHHFLLGRQDKSDLEWQISIPLDVWLSDNRSDLDQAPLLAVLGCLLLENLGNSDDSSITTALNHFVDGVDRLKQRQNIFTSPNSWILNSEVVLGLSLGVFTVHVNQNIKIWLRDILEAGVARKELPNFLRFTYLYCLFLSGQDSRAKFETKDIYESVTELAFDIWLARRYTNYLVYRELSSDWLEVSQSKLLQECLLSDLQIRDSWKAAIVWCVISDYVYSRSQYPRLDLINSMLSNFEAAMERWDTKWKIENEYDIQGILWLILRTVFNDLRYEESFPKLGRRGHRDDIAVPQLGLIIEVKYTRKSGDFQKILDEVSKDAVQINTQAVYKDILVFVYDESCSVEQHSWAKNAIESIDHIKGCVIKSAPSTTRLPAKNTPKKK